MSDEHMAYVKRICDRFERATDASGKLLHPHFHAVMELMGDIMLADPVLRSMPDGLEKMEKAYALAMESMPSEAETGDLLAKALKRK